MKYDYTCQDCGKKFVMVYSMLDRVDVICPNCCSKNVQRKWGVPGIIFRGGGFYVNDSKKGGK